MFVAYHKVVVEGEHISLMQLATVVLQVMGDQSMLDAVLVYIHENAGRLHYLGGERADSCW